MSSSSDTTFKTLTVAFLLCVVCSGLVSTAAVKLKPIQQETKLLDRKRNILAAAGLLEPGVDVDQAFQQIQVKYVDFATGEFNDELTETYEQRKAAKDPKLSQRLEREQDIANIKRRADYAPVYLVRSEQGELETLILPVHGYGLWSTLYGFLALKADTKTVVGLGFYEHKETPGLGGEVDNPAWKSLWPGKQAFDDNWQPAIALVKGEIDHSSEKSRHKIDALSGATLTGNGVTNLVQFWLGDLGFGPFLARVREQGGQL